MKINTETCGTTMLIPDYDIISVNGKYFHRSQEKEIIQYINNLRFDGSKQIEIEGLKK